MIVPDYLYDPGYRVGYLGALFQGWVGYMIYATPVLEKGLDPRKNGPGKFSKIKSLFQFIPRTFMVLKFSGKFPGKKTFSPRRGDGSPGYHSPDTPLYPEP